MSWAKEEMATVVRPKEVDGGLPILQLLDVVLVSASVCGKQPVVPVPGNRPFRHITRQNHS